MNRMGRFLELGFNEEQADALAEEIRIDWHDVKALLDEGCPPNIAFLIVF